MTPAELRALPLGVVDISGQRFGRLVADSYVGRSKWLCRCDCGNGHKARGCDLRDGGVRSCGCLHDEASSKRMTRHGHSRRSGRSAEYRAWCNMIGRCTNPNVPEYEYYGARGIAVCDRWLASFEDFFADIGARPSAGHSVDRKDTTGNYEPGNVKWSTRAEQMANRTTTVRLTIDGETLTTYEWSNRYGIPRTVINNRVNRGWNHKRAVTEQLRGWPKKKVSK